MKLLLFVCLLCSFFFYCYVLFIDTDYDHTIIYIRESHSKAIPIQLRLLKNVQSAKASISPNPRANITNISSFEQSSLEAPLFFATVESVIKRNTINETIILFCTDNGYIDLFLNGYYASQLWNYKNLAVVCFDRLCYQKLYKLNIPVALLNVESDTSVDITKAAVCHTKEFQNKVHYKLVSSRGMAQNTRKSISCHFPAATHFLPFSAISYQITAATHFLPLPAIFCHYLPGYLIVHNKKRAETHGCQFRQISAMLTLTSIVGHSMHGCDGATTLPREESSIPPHCLVV